MQKFDTELYETSTLMHNCDCSVHVEQDSTHATSGRLKYTLVYFETSGKSDKSVMAEERFLDFQELCIILFMKQEIQAL